MAEAPKRNGASNAKQITQHYVAKYLTDKADTQLVLFAFGTLVRLNANDLKQHKVGAFQVHRDNFPYHRFTNKEAALDQIQEIEKDYKLIIDKCDAENRSLVSCAYAKLHAAGYPWPGGDSADSDTQCLAESSPPSRFVSATPHPWIALTAMFHQNAPAAAVDDAAEKANVDEDAKEGKADDVAEAAKAVKEVDVVEAAEAAEAAKEAEAEDGKQSGNVLWRTIFPNTGGSKIFTLMLEPRSAHLHAVDAYGRDLRRYDLMMSRAIAVIKGQRVILLE